MLCMLARDTNKKYTIRIVKGALIHPAWLAQFNPRVIKKFENLNWDSLMEFELTLDEIKDAQKQMVKHYSDPTPWYMDGYAVWDHNCILVAFGADDGEGGRIFNFDRNDQGMFKKVVAYAFLKGIPKEQMDFLDES